MENVIKVMSALKTAFPGHNVESRFIEGNYSTESVFIDGKCVGHFYEDFFQKDFDNPEIEIKIKARLNDIKDFLYECEGSGGVAVVMKEVERGLAEWEKESHPNN